MNWLFQIRKLKNVRRCGVLRVNNPETVAEHCFFVTALVTDIGRKVENERNIKIDWPSLLQKALFHDIEEGITGDIPYPVKYASQPLHELLEAAKDQIVEEFFPDWLVELNVEAKHGIEGEIVHMADYIELYFYCAEEKLLGNRDRYWDDIMKTCRKVCSLRVFEEISNSYFDIVDRYLREGGLHDENRRMSGGKVG